jgi:hypothetical protein
MRRPNDHEQQVHGQPILALEEAAGSSPFSDGASLGTGLAISAWKTSK